MAESAIKLKTGVISEVRELLWGNSVKDDIFCRWAQAFCFSENEPTALMQHEGGPCAVIAPVQGFLLRHILFESKVEDLSAVTEQQSREALIQSLIDILLEVHSTGKYTILSVQTDEIVDSATNPEKISGVANPKIGSHSNDTQKSTDDPSQSPNQTSVKDTNTESTSTQKSDSEECVSTLESNSKGKSALNRENDPEERNPKRRRLDQELFHSRLRCTECNDEESLRSYMKSLENLFTDNYGVILFLYSVILTKGTEQIKNEMEDPCDPLIDPVHGHGSQSLINLLLCGKAVSNVWDNNKNVSGLKLYGIHKRTNIGFLALMEHLRYCEVGWYLKNPFYPIWILASETHLTVLFSKERNLVVTESNQSNAKVMFQTFDPEGNGFISTALLGDLLSALDLVAEKEYVDIMKEKLDSEDLGIITLNGFMQEFYPEESTENCHPTKFDVYHYNGLARSCQNGKVTYKKGQATLPEELELQIITDLSPMKLCLQTKWPTLEIEWTDNEIPSLN